MLNSRVYALTDEYEKFGKLGNKGDKTFHYHYKDSKMKQPKHIKGGLNGRNLK